MAASIKCRIGVCPASAPLRQIGAKVVSHGGSSDPKKPLRRHPAADLGTATAAGRVNSVRRSVSRIRQNPQEKCVLIAKSSALSTFGLASACLGAPSVDG